MKKSFVFLLVFLLFSSTNINAFWIFSEMMSFNQLLKEKDKITTQVENDLLTSDERRMYVIECNAVTNTSKGLIEYVLAKESNGMEERIGIRAFHAHEKEKPFSSVLDYIQRDIKEFVPSQTDGMNRDTKYIKSSENDCLYLIKKWNNRKTDNGIEEFVNSETLVRAIFLNGRIFSVQRNIPRRQYSQEERKKWVEKFENIAFFNNILKEGKFGEEPCEKTKNPKRRVM